MPRPNEVQDLPLSTQGLLVEELDPAQRCRAGTARCPFLVLEGEKVPAQLLLAAAEEHLSRNPKGSLAQIDFCIIDETTVRVFADEWRKKWQ